MSLIDTNNEKYIDEGKQCSSLIMDTKSTGTGIQEMRTGKTKPAMLFDNVVVLLSSRCGSHYCIAASIKEESAKLSTEEYNRLHHNNWGEPSCSIVLELKISGLLFNFSCS